MRLYSNETPRVLFCQTGMDSDKISALKEQLTTAIGGGESHILFDKVVEDFPFDKAGTKLPGAPHSAWELLEHMRIAQSDILEFSRDSSHKSPKFPDGYWPKTSAPADEGEWKAAIQRFQHDAKEMESLIQRSDLFAKIPHGKGQTLLREALVVSNHNSYHLGELVFLKRMLLGV